MDDMLFRACRDFVNEQSEGEWSADQVDGDARKMAEFIDRVRPARPKLNMEVTPEIVAILDGSAAREDEAWKIAQLAATLVAGNATPNDAQSVRHWPVNVARALLAESRRQIAEPTP